MKQIAGLKRLMRGGNTLSRNCLYQAEDHFLFVQGFVREEYRRIYYRDLEAVLWCPDREAPWLIGCLMGVLVLGGGGFILSGDEIWQDVVGWILLIPGLLVLPRYFYILFTGGYFKLFMGTATQQIQLSGMTSARKRRILLEALEPQFPNLFTGSMPTSSENYDADRS